MSAVDQAGGRTRSTGWGRASLVVVACVSASLGLQAGQSPEVQLPTFRTEVRFVEVDAIVRDRDGNFVADLTKDDFEILEDGTPQDVATISVLNLPVDRSGRPAEASAGGLDAPVPLESTADAGRIYVMILDSGEGERVREIARQFIVEYLGPTDLMAVVHTADPDATQGLTNDKERLLESVDQYALGLPGVAAFRAIKDVAVNLNSVSGRRKAIVFIGRGTGLLWAAVQDSRLIELQRLMWREYDDAVKTAARNNVRIYPVDPSGMRDAFRGIDFASSRPPAPGNSGASAPREGIRQPGLFRGPDANPTRLRPRPGQPSADAQSELRMMAEDTGGIAIVNTNNFSGNLRHVVRDNSAYYVLGYYSPAPRDGRFHRITVRLKNRPDLSVRGSRAGYTAVTPDVKGRAAKLPKGLSAAARDVLRAAEPVTGLALEVFTAVYRGDGFDGSVLIGAHVPGAGLELTRNARIELSYAAVDRWGTVRAAERRAYTMNFTETTRTRVGQTGLRLFGRLRLPRGSYQIRVAAHQPGGATGSAVSDVEIPDYADLPLSFSNLVIASTEEPRLLTLAEDPTLRRELPAQPTPARRFSRADTLTIFGEIYDSHWILSQEIGATLLVTAQDGRLVARQEDQLASANHGRFYYSGRLPLAQFEPGTYTLTVEAHTRAGVPASVSQQVRFEIEGT